MKKNTFYAVPAFFLVAFLCLSTVADAAQSVGDHLRAGRNHLKKQTDGGLFAAHREFRKAVVAAPRNEQANVLYVGTLFIKENAARDLLREARSIGVEFIDPSPYDWQISLSVDRRGWFKPLRNAATGSSIERLQSRRELLQEILKHLRRVKSQNFILRLSAAETSTTPVQIDLGDVHTLRAIALTALAALDLSEVYDLETKYFAIYRQVVAPNPSPRKVIRAFPGVMGFGASPAKRLAARSKLVQANREIQSAVRFINTKRVSSRRDYLFETESKADARRLRALAATFAKSLMRPTKLPLFVGLEGGRTVDLSKLIESSVPPRFWLPRRFDRGFVRPGAWKDPTFGGAFPDATKADVDDVALEARILQNTRYQTPYWFRTMAGRFGREGYGGRGKAALFGDIAALATDKQGNIYVADGRNHVIRRIARNGRVSDVVGKRWVNNRQLQKQYAAHYNSGNSTQPSGIFYNFGGGLEVDGNGNIYFTADNVLYKFVRSNGRLVHLAGGASGFPKDGLRKNAAFAWATDIALDNRGRILVCDKNAVRRVTPSGRVTTLAGKLGWHWNGAEGHRDGAGRVARFDSLAGIAVAPSGDIFVADGDNAVIRKIKPNGRTTTFAGRVREGGTVFDAKARRARFAQILRLDIDDAGNLYVLDRHVVRKITRGGVVTTIAGDTDRSGYRDGSGWRARFDERHVRALAVERNGRVLVATHTTIQRGTKLGAAKR